MADCALCGQVVKPEPVVRKLEFSFDVDDMFEMLSDDMFDHFALDEDGDEVHEIDYDKINVVPEFDDEGKFIGVIVRYNQVSNVATADNQPDNHWSTST